MFTILIAFFALWTYVVSFKTPLSHPFRKPSKLKSSVHGITPPAVRTLLIDNFDSYTYNVWQLLADVNGIEPHVVYNNAYGGDWNAMLKSVPTFDNIVLSPGPGSPDNPSDFGLCLDAILKSTVPLLGVCLGHQGMAHAYGGKVTRAPVPMHGRLSAIQHSNTGIFAGVPQQTEVVRYHSLVADAPLPQELRSTAWTAEGIIMGLEHKVKPQFGVQFHPESVKTESGRRIFTNFRDVTLKRIKGSSEHERPDVNVKVHSFAKPVSTTTTTTPVPTTALHSTPTTSPQRHVHTTSFALPHDCAVSTEEVFRYLYGRQDAAFWLDSECPGPVQVLRSHSTSSVSSASDSGTCSKTVQPVKSRLSYMGALDRPGAYAIEYTTDRRLIKRTLRHSSAVNDDGVEVLPLNIFEYLRQQLQLETTADTTHTHTTHQLHKHNTPPIISHTDTSTNTNTILPSMHSALFGYLGYEVGYESAQILASQSTTDAHFILNSTNSVGSIGSGDNVSTGSPAALLLHPSQYIVYDHVTHTYHVIDLNTTHTASTPKSETLAHRLHSFLQSSIDDTSTSTPDTTILSSPTTTTHPATTLTTNTTLGAHITHSTHTTPTTPTLTAWKSRAAYKNDIASALQSIVAGETYEVCLTTQFQGPLPEHTTSAFTSFSSSVDLTAHGLHTYRTLRRLNRAPYACYLRYDPAAVFGSRPAQAPQAQQATLNIKIDAGDKAEQEVRGVQYAEWFIEGGLAICSTSPECFLRASQDGTLISRPIKGTVRRNLADPATDLRIAQSLAADEKSQAENLMIVDLVRNDLGRVCAVGSVHVPGLMEIESYATVHQMVSTVNGTLRRGCDAVDALVATYPGGSMTGAPKLRTMEIIQALEQRPRGVYSGSMGYIGLNGAVDLNIVIRTAVLTNQGVSIGAGGAIVAMSDPDEEVDEVELKVQAVAKALGYKVDFPQS